VAAEDDGGAPDGAPIGAPAPADDVELAEPAEVDPIMTLTRERDDYRDALIHLQADFENYKKRMIKQQTDHLERAATALVDKLLPVLDTADLALAHGGGEDVKQVTGALTNVLEREGLERIDPVGDPFDPTLHDAVAHEPSDDGQQEVVEVMRAGYRWKGRVLRPAMVKVRG
jgi:molecular chaperone GrpE